eukprot:318486-Pyramimonas_sp.AAC.1
MHRTAVMSAAFDHAKTVIESDDDDSILCWQRNTVYQESSIFNFISNFNTLSQIPTMPVFG